MIPSQFTPTQEELSLADIILSKALDGQIKREDPAAAKLDADTAVKVFLTTKLSPQVLSEIWSEADIGEKGWLTRHGKLPNPSRNSNIYQSSGKN